METLGFKRPKEHALKIDYIIRNREPFFEIVKMTRDLYGIKNRVTEKIITEAPRPRGVILEMLEKLI